MVFLTIVEWVVIGLLVGFIVSRAVNLHGDDPRLGMFCAAGVAVLVAAIYTYFSGAGMNPWRPWTLACAAAAALGGAVVWHAVRSRSISHDRYTPRSSY